MWETGTFHSTNYMRPPTRTTGIFSSAVALDREDVDRYDLIMDAADITFTPLLGYANVTVFVLDQNDNDPIIDGDSKLYFDIPECPPFTSPLVSFTVSV